MTQEQIEQKKQLLKQTLEEAKALRDELQAAGALQLNEDELDKVAGGYIIITRNPGYDPINDVPHF